MVCAQQCHGWVYNTENLWCVLNNVMVAAELKAYLLSNNTMMLGTIHKV
jgi:hypothetical protein